MCWLAHWKIACHATTSPSRLLASKHARCRPCACDGRLVQAFLFCPCLVLTISFIHCLCRAASSSSAGPGLGRKFWQLTALQDFEHIGSKGPFFELQSNRNSMAQIGSRRAAGAFNAHIACRCPVQELQLPDLLSGMYGCAAEVPSMHATTANASSSVLTDM